MKKDLMGDEELQEEWDNSSDEDYKDPTLYDKGSFHGC